MPPDVAPPPHPVGWDDLTGRLRVLRATAGSPSYADLVRRVDTVRAERGVPVHERRPGRVTVYDAFRDGRARMDVELLADLVRALGGSAADADAWRAAHASVATATARASAGAGGTGASPEPHQTPTPRLLDEPPPETLLPRLRGRDAELAALLDWAAPRGAGAPGAAHAPEPVPGCAPAGASGPTAVSEPAPAVPCVAVVTGVPGAGLSTLARAVAARHHTSTGGTVRIGRVGGGAPVATDVEALLAALPTPDDVVAPALLVLIDVTDPALVQAVVAGAPGWAVLVTARRSLPVDGARRIALGPLAPDAAVAALGDLVGADRVAAEPEAAAALAAACGYLPVSLAVAAGQVTERPAWSLADHRHRVEQSAHALPALDAAYRALDPEQALVLRRLALVDAPLTTPWLAVLAGLDAPSVRRSLAVLEDAHLVQAHGGGRSTVHDLVRRFAREAAHEEEPVSARRSAVERLTARLTETARPLVAVVAPHHDVVAGTDPGAVSPADARAQLDALRSVAVGAGVLCAELGLARPLGDLSGLLAAYLDTAGHWPDALVLHGAAADAADPAGRSRAGRDVGRTLEHLGRYDEALAHLVRAHESGHDPRPGQTLNRIGNVYKRLGRTDDALRSYADAATAARTAGDAVSEARAVGNHADALRVLGRHDESFAGYDTALALAERIGDVLNVAVVTSNSALALEHVGRLTEARERVALARAAADRLGDANLGLRAALHEQRLLLTPAPGPGDGGGYGPALTGAPLAAGGRDTSRGTTAKGGQGDARTTAAVAALRDLRVQAQDLGEVEAEAETLVVLGQALHRAGDLPGAVDALTEARDRAVRLRAGLVEVEALTALGAVLLASDRPHDARAAYDEALRLAVAAGDAGEQVRARTGLGDCADATGDPARAAACWREALGAAPRARPTAVAALRARLGEAPPED